MSHPPTQRTVPAALASSRLSAELAGVCRRQLLVNLGRGLGLAVMVLLLLVGAQMLLDWWFDLPWLVRLGLLTVDLVVLGILVHGGLYRPFQQRLDLESAALLVEQCQPGLQSRLIAAVQLPQSAESRRNPGLVAKLVAQTEAQTAELDWSRVVPAQACRRQLLMAILAVLGFGLLYFQQQPASTDLLQRLLLDNVALPRKTRVQCLTGPRLVARGDSLVVRARAQGVVPPLGKLEILHASGRTQEFPMSPVAGQRGLFSCRLDSVLESFQYRVRLNDGVSDSFAVRVEPPPGLVSLRCVQVYPAYTGLAARPRALGDLVLLAGSRLQLSGMATKPLQQAQARLVGSAQPLPLAIDPAQPRQWQGELAIPQQGLSGLALHLQDQLGLRSRDEVVYPLEILPDRSPTVQLTHPTRREQLLVSGGELLVAFEASDDFGLEQVALHYRRAGTGMVQVVELELAEERPRTLRRRYPWPLAEVQPPVSEGESLEYWIEVRDANDLTGPGAAQSERHYLRVVSAAEKRAELLGRLDDYLEGLATVTGRQEQLSERLGAWIRARRR